MLEEKADNFPTHEIWNFHQWRVEKVFLIVLAIFSLAAEAEAGPPQEQTQKECGWFASARRLLLLAPPKR